MLSKFELEILPDVVAYMKHDVSLNSLLKPLRDDRERVFTQGKVREQEQACFISDRVVLRPGRIFHLPRDFSGVHLSKRGRNAQNQAAYEGDCNAGVSCHLSQPIRPFRGVKYCGIRCTHDSTHEQPHGTIPLNVVLRGYNGLAFAAVRML